MKSFAAMLGEAKMPEKTVPVCLRGDLTADFEEVDRQLEAAQKKPASSLAGSGTGALLERLDALAVEMAEHTYTFRLRAMPRHAWLELMAAHPPRKDDEGDPLVEDRMTGANRLTVFEPMVRMSIIDPELDDEQWKKLLAALTDRQFEDLVNAAWDLNQGKVDVPFSRAASQARRTTSDG